MSHATLAPRRDTSSVQQARERLIKVLFPTGVPRLWCPTLTHFRAKGELDPMGMERHLNHLAPYAKGLLVPGSTGEGWEMSDDDIRRLLAVVLEAARPAGVHVLVGVLKHTVSDMLRCIDSTVTWLKSRANAATSAEALARSGVVGFTVCPPKGDGLSQAEIDGALSRILERGLPTALYQLPQWTMSWHTVPQRRTGNHRCFTAAYGCRRSSSKRLRHFSVRRVCFQTQGTCIARPKPRS